MSGKISRSWTIAKASARVLASQPDLMILPVLALLGTVAVMAAVNFGVAEPIGLHNLFSPPPADQLEAKEWEIEHFAVLYLFFFAANTVVTFFGVALSSAVLARFRGEGGGVASGIARAVKMIGPIVMFAGLSALLSVVQSLLRERGGAAGRAASGVIGISAGVATYLIKPVLAAEDVNATGAVRRSAVLMRNTWGENIISNLAFGVFFMAVFVVAILIGGLTAAVLLPDPGTRPVGVLIIVGLVLLVLIIMVLQSALVNVYRTALYLYAVEGTLPASFSQAQVDEAFRKKAGALA